MQDEQVELQVESVSGDERADTISAHAERGRPGGSLVVVLLLLAGVVAVIVTDTVISPDGNAATAPTTIADPADSPLATFEADRDAETGDEGDAASAFPAIRLAAMASTVGGSLALVPVVDDDRRDETAVWLVDGGRVTTLYDLHFAAPGLVAVLDRRHPVVHTTGALLVPDAENDLLVLQPLGSTAQRITREGASTIIDGAAPGEVWLLGDDGASVTRIRPAAGAGRTPTADRFALDDGFRAEAGVADGLVGHDDADRPARWSPVDGTVPLRSAPDGFLPIVGASGDLVAFTEPGRGNVSVIDARADERVADVPLGDDLVTTCFSPDGRFLAARHYDTDAERGEGAPALSDHVTVTDLGRRTPSRRRFTLPAPVGDITWLSPTHLVVSTAEEVSVIDMADFSLSTFAELVGASWWLLDSDASSC